jgi:anti-sigma factor RsiW
MTCRTDNDLGAYVMNALEPDEIQSVRAHLTGCPACREEVRSLEDAAALLALLTVQDIEQLFGPEPVADAAASARPRRRGAALAPIAAVLIAATTVGGVQVLSGGSGPSPPRIVQVVDPTTHVQAAVTMTGRSWGTQLHLSLTGAYPSGWCSLVAHSRDGQSDISATWVADAHGAANIDGLTAIRTSRLTELDVIVTATGARLVRINLPRHGS